jgi:hypothetical protein
VYSKMSQRYPYAKRRDGHAFHVHIPLYGGRVGCGEYLYYPTYEEGAAYILAAPEPTYIYQNPYDPYLYEVYPYFSYGEGIPSYGDVSYV